MSIVHQTMKRGDTAPALVLQLMRLDGTIPDLTQASVQCVLYPGDEQGNKVDGGDPRGGAAAVTDLPTAEVSYAWGLHETSLAGEILAEFEVTYHDATVETFPKNGYLRVLITEDLGGLA